MKEVEFTEKQILDLAQKTYEEGNAKFDVLKAKCALLVIDMQDEFVKPHWTPYWVPEATRQVPRIKKLIESCRGEGVPVIYTVYSNTYNRLDRPNSLDFMPIRYLDSEIDQSSYFMEGNVWHELAPEGNEIVIHKPSYGAFCDTPLETILKNLKKDTVIVCGTMTNYCCGSTARQAFERGFKVVFGSDTTSAHFPDLQEAELKILRRGYARVLSTDEICKSL